MKTILSILLLASASCFAQAPVVIQPTDAVSSSRDTINTNFSNLYTTGTTNSSAISGLNTSVNGLNSGLATTNSNLATTNANVGTNTTGISTLSASQVSRSTPSTLIGGPIFDPTLRTAIGSHTSGLSSTLQGGAQPERDQSITQPVSYVLNQAMQFGAVIPASSNLYEMDTIFAVCENLGGGFPNSGPGIVTQNACVPIKAFGQAQTANSPTWGANIEVANFPPGGVTGEIVPGGDSELTGLEIDLATYFNDSPTIPKVGLSVIAEGGAVEAGSAIVVGGNGSTTGWRYALEIGSSALYTGATGIHIEPQTGFVPAIGINLEGVYSDSAIRIANPEVIRFTSVSGTDGFMGMSAADRLSIQKGSTGTFAVADNTGSAMLSIGGSASAATYFLVGMGTTPGSLQPVCVNTSTGQLYKGSGGVC